MRASAVLPFAFVATLVHACENDHLGPEGSHPVPAPTGESAGASAMVRSTGGAFGGGPSSAGSQSVGASSGGGSGAPDKGRALDAGPGSDGGAARRFTFRTPRTPICAGVCGNGMIDSCMETCSHLGPCPPLQEQCDPTVPAEVTCETLGYTGGQIGCTAWCSFDQTGCIACVEAGGSLLSCERAPVDSAEVQSISVAVNSDKVGVAWTTVCSGCGATNQVHLAAFDASLHVLFEPSPPGTAVYPDVALAHSADEWLLATSGDAGVVIYGFDDRGVLRGAHTIANGRDPVFGVRPGAAPLLVWTVPSSNPSEDGVRQAAMLTDDGDLATQAATLWASPESRAGVLFVGDGFLVAQRGGTAIHTAHIALSGAVLSSSPMPFGDSTESPRLVPFGKQVGVTYLAYSTPSALKWAVVDTAGSIVTPPAPLTPQPNIYNPDVYDVLSKDAGLLLIGPSPIGPSPIPNSELAASSIDSSGRLSPGAYVIAKSGRGFASPVLKQFEDHAVAAWIEGATGDPNTVSTLYLGMLSLK